MTDFGQRPRQLLKTGQKNLIHIGDDGDLERGLAHDYTVLTTGQHAGTFDITVNAKTHALSNNIVQDNSTGLMWCRYVCDGDIGPDGDGKLLWTDAVNSEDIFELVARANSGSGLGGYIDWKVPNKREMDSLVDLESVNPSIDGIIFPSTPSAEHWASSSISSTYGWIIKFNNGYHQAGLSATAKHYCRFVRGGS